jgi:hypothetical protein
MHFRIPAKWNIFAEGTPGHRFRDRYHAHRRSHGSHSVWHRLRRMLLAFLATAIGVVLAVIPGPAIPFFFLAGALLATDWLWMARLLDWTEVKMRAWWKRAVHWWKQRSPAGRVVLATAGVGLSLATTYGAYQLMQ